MKDDLKVSFVVPCYKGDEFIERNLLSLLDQDYKNWDAVVILNGVWETKEPLAFSLREKFPKDKIRVISIPEPGLGNANNVGLRASDGDIVSHLSSDLYLMPGALRTWVEAFKEHPDCGLVYSGYRFTGNDTSQVYPSNPFSLYHLKCENFIDGANPYRRQFAPQWSTSLKSLIDWDAMLQVAEKTNAWYIKEPLYWAEPPKRGGLSDDSSRNWLKRWKEVRSIHGIQDNPICIASLDYPPLALKMAELLETDFRINPGFKPHDYRLIYAYGFDCSVERIQYNCSMFMRHFGHKIIHWIGEDIKSFMKQQWATVDYFADNVMKRVNENWVMDERDRDVLRKMWVDAEVVYPAIDLPSLNDVKKEAISVNDLAVMEQLQKAMPDQEFFNDDISCGITVHIDDHPENILRSICAGNNVIANKPMAGLNYICGFTNVPELRKMLVHSIRKIKKDGEKPVQETVQAYRSKVNPKKMKDRLMKLAEKQIHKYGKLDEMQTAEA